MRTFPLIPPTCESALLLYGCAYLGENDAWHVRDAGIRDVTVVDIDQAAISEMAPLYPDGWKFVCSDVADFVPRDEGYDLVVADPWGGDDMDQLHRWIPRLYSIPRDMLIVGGYTPEGMIYGCDHVVVRNPNYCWLVWNKTRR